MSLFYQYVISSVQKNISSRNVMIENADDSMISDYWFMI